MSKGVELSVDLRDALTRADPACRSRCGRCRLAAPDPRSK